MLFHKKEVNTGSVFKDASELKANQSKYPIKIKTPEEIKARIEGKEISSKRSWLLWCS